MGNDKMSELLQQKRALVEDILHLACIQSTLLLPEGAEKLLNVIEKKQQCIEEINALDEIINKMEDESPGSDLYTELRDGIARQLKEIMNKDDLNRQRLLNSYEQIRRDMDSFQSGKGTVKAYQSPGGISSGYFIDKTK